MLKIGIKAPEFKLKDYQNKEYSLNDFKGKKVILYFYPKDNTSGCTKEALAFNELINEFKELNAIIIGISKDSINSHQKFIEKYNLNILLLSDESLDTIKAYESYGEKSLYGKKYMGTLRNTYIIDENGMIIYAKNKVNPSLEATSCLNFIHENNN